MWFGLENIRYGVEGRSVKTGVGEGLTGRKRCSGGKNGFGGGGRVRNGL